MKKTKLLCLLLVLIIMIPVLPLQVSAFATDTGNAFTATSQINGISLTQKGTSGGGAMLEQGSIDGIRITQTACNGYAEEGIMVNIFANNSHFVDLTNVKWIAFEYANTSVEARTSLVKLQDSNNIQAYANTDANVVHTDSNFENAKAITKIDPYLRTTSSFVGWVFVPMSAYTNMGLGNELVAIYLLLNSYDAALNDSAIEFGRIMTYTEETITDYSKGTVIADLASWEESDITPRIVTSSATRITEIKKVEKSDAVVEIPIIYDFGDVRILEDFTRGYPTDVTEFNTLMSNKVDQMVGGLVAEKYSEVIHEGNALKLTVVEPIENKRDDYAAITFSAKSSVNKWMQWENDEGNIEGITFYLANVSGAEVTLCFEIDEYDPDQDVATDYRGERWSVGLGGRVILYDTVTGQQMLVHSNPMISIPAGFIGWVRIPVSCFTKAAWCSWGNSTFDLVRVAQFTFAAYGPINMGNSFVLDSVGLYYNQTVVESIFGDNGNSIADNLR